MTDLIKLAKECGAVQWKPAKVWLTCFNSVDKLRAFAEAVIREREREQCDAVVPPKGE